MLKYLIILNVLVILVVTQDVPPPDLEISTTAEPITTTTTEATTTAAVTTTEAATTTTEATTTTTEAETTEEPTTTPESLTTTTSPTLDPSTTPGPNDVSSSRTTDSPFSTTTTTTKKTPYYPNYPSYPDYFGLKCYFKKQYGYAQLRWTCNGLKYVYPLECFKCCHFKFSNFAGCYRVHGQHCNVVNHHHGFYKR